VIAVGRPKIINVPARWAKFRRPEEFVPHSDYALTRSDYLPPIIPTRSRARTPGPPLDTSFSATSMPTPLTASSQPNISPDNLYSSTTLNREVSVFSMPGFTTPASLTPPMSDHGSDSPSFLQSDPFENAQPFKRSHSRLRSLSKFKPFNSKLQSADEPTLKNLKRQRRVSLIRRPATPPSFFDNRSSSDSNTDAIPHPSSSQPLFTAPLKSTPTQRSFPKMVARGANEIEPTLRLPPCPRDYDQELRTLHRSQTYVDSSSRKSTPSPTSMKRRQSTLGLGF